MADIYTSHYPLRRTKERGTAKVITVKRALVSVSNKEGIVEFAQGLVELGVELVSTGGTARALAEAGLPVRPVSELTGFPEILGGRVKTLHPAVHAGILFRRDVVEDRRQLEELGIGPIDLVAVNLYPFAETVAKPGVTLAEAIENIDIGGPTMIRAAAKNYQHVAVVVNPVRYPEVLRELKEQGGSLSQETAFHLAVEAFAHTAQYDAVISNFLGSRLTDQGFPSHLFLALTKLQDLRYGENPHQRAAFYGEAGATGASLVRARQLQGKPLSFNNINDANAALELVQEFRETAVVAVKHTNPCGVALGETVLEAYRRAYEADPVSIFGGIVAANRPIDVATARAMMEIFLEVVIAPGYEEEALAIFKEKPNLRVLEVADLQQGSRQSYLDFKRVRGGLLVQDVDLLDLDRDKLQVVTRREPSEQEWKDLFFAWKVVKHVKSNAIVVASRGKTLGIGAGQMNRVGAARIALKQAGPAAAGSVMASDAFFPMPDTVETAAQAGVKAIIQPGGSIRDEDSIKAADEAGIAMVFTGTRHFKH